MAQGRWVKGALLVSLALNLLVAGLVAGALLGRDDHRPSRRDAGLRALGATPFVMALEPGDRAVLAKRMKQRAAPWERNRAALRARFEQVLGLLRQEPFDGAAFRAALAETRSAAAARQGLGEELLAAHLEQMSPLGRAEYAARLDRSLRRGSERQP